MAKQGNARRGPRKRATRNRHTVEYPAHVLKPEDLLDFIELPVFTKRWEHLGLNDDDLSALQILIMVAPKAAKVIEKTDGIRKMRFAPSRWKTGQSGAARVLYVYFEKFGIVLLCLVYGKSEIDNISSSTKKCLNKMVAEIEREFHRRYPNK